MHTFRSALRAMRLHGDVGIEMVQSAIRLLAAIPATLVHSLDLLVSPPRPLMLLRTRDRDERVHLVAKLSRQYVNLF